MGCPLHVHVTSCAVKPFPYNDEIITASPDWLQEAYILSNELSKPGASKSTPVGEHNANSGHNCRHRLLFRLAAMQKLTWTQVAAWRAQQHFLGERTPARSALKVVSRLCGLHAQVLSSSELTLWARVEGLKRGAVSRALWKDRTLVKTWAMRGTLHLLPACELNLWHAVLGTSQR